MTTLTQIINYCEKHIRACSEAYVPESEIGCRNCSGLDKSCPDFISYNPNHEYQTRQGLEACNLMRCLR